MYTLANYLHGGRGRIMLDGEKGVVNTASKQKPDVRAIRECLAYLVKETERANYHYCALHLRLAIEELDSATINIGSGANDSITEVTGR